MRTQRAEVHEAGEGDGPDVLGVDNVATIELEEEPVLDIRVCEHGIKHKRSLANQLFKADIEVEMILSAL